MDMKRTDRRDGEQALDRFVKRLAATMQQTRNEQANFLDTGLDDDAESYYVPHRHAETGPLAAAIQSFTVDDLGIHLESLWKQEGRMLLAKLAGRLPGLARRLRATAPPTAHLSPYVYEMF